MSCDWAAMSFAFRIGGLTLRRFLSILCFPLSQLEPSVSVRFVSTFPCDYWRSTERSMPFTIPFIPTLARIASTSFHSSHQTNYTQSQSVYISAHYAFLIIVTQTRELIDGYDEYSSHSLVFVNSINGKCIQHWMNVIGRPACAMRPFTKRAHVNDS